MPALVLTLRHNINLEADAALAHAEAAALSRVPADSIENLTHAALLNWLLEHGILPGSLEHRFLTRSLRKGSTVALLIDAACKEQFHRIIERASFIQEAVFIDSPSDIRNTPILQRLSRLNPVTEDSYIARGIPVATLLEYSATFVFRRDRIGSVSAALDALTEYLLDDSPPPSGLGEHLNDAVKAKKTTLYLSHELHLYKGKFFPRLVHSLINRYAPPDNDGLICDPFVGSGTALLEASLLGYRSVGIDVDPTSVLISQNKTSLASVDCDELLEICQAMQAALEDHQLSLFFEERTYHIDDWERYVIQVPEPMRYRLAKRGTEEGYDLLGEIEKDSAIALCLIAQIPTHLQPLFRICLSHALTKKIRLRFVGIGNGRFTFDVAKVRVIELFLKKAYQLLATAEAFAWLNRTGVHLGTVEVHRDSAIHLTSMIAPGSADLIVTSPPYIPASSGREHYARARAIPLILTGAAALDELEELDRQFIGEMSGQALNGTDIADMPETVRRTLHFLSNDVQRLPKYLPTLQYYRDIREVLHQVRTVLSENGTALVVVASTHTFYVHKTKNIVHTVDATRAMCEIGEQAGLHVAEVIDVPLMKSGGLNARPRSTDEYSEAVIVFRKN